MLTNKQKLQLMRMYMRPALIVSGQGSISAFAFLTISDLETLADMAMFLSMLKLARLQECSGGTDAERPVCSAL